MRLVYPPMQIVVGVASWLSVDFLRDDFIRRAIAVCLLSGIEKRPLVGDYLYTSAIVISISDTAGVHIEVVRWWEGRYGRFHCIPDVY